MPSPALTLTEAALECPRQFLCVCLLSTFWLPQVPCPSSVTLLWGLVIEFSLLTISDTRTAGTPEAFFAQVYSGASGKPRRLISSTRNEELRALPGWSRSVSEPFTSVRAKKRTKRCHLAPLLSSAFPVLLPLPLCSFICLRGPELFLEHSVLVAVLQFPFVFFSFILSFSSPVKCLFPSGLAYMLLYILQLRPHICRQREVTFIHSLLSSLWWSGRNELDLQLITHINPGLVPFRDGYWSSWLYSLKLHINAPFLLATSGGKSIPGCNCELET